MSDESSYSGEESSAYSYHDLAIYQYSDVKEDLSDAPVPRQVPATVPQHEAAKQDTLWDWEDNDSYVMYTQSDNDEFERYQYSDEDLIPEEPDEDWIVAALLNNRLDYDHVELLIKEIENFPRLMEAMQMNRIINNVTIYESFFDAIPTREEMVILAETVCSMQNLESLKVYYQSSFFVEPLERIRPPKLKRLCLMFFPGIADNGDLVKLSNILREGKANERGIVASVGGDIPDTVHHTMALESLSLRCDLMDDTFIQAIADGMATNSSLTTLSFWGNKTQVSDDGNFASSKIDFYLKLNQCGIRDFYLMVTVTPAEFLNKLVTERESLDLVFYLLQSNPSFVSYSTLLRS